MTVDEIDLDLWKLPPGEYILAIGLFTRDEDGKALTVSRSEARIQVHTQRESTYYFGQVTDLKRRARKLEKAVGRLFK